MTPESYDALIALHEGDWTEGLISGDLAWIYNKVLSPVEREVTCMKIAGYVNGEISIQLGMKISSVERHIYNIEYKYRNGMGRRIDNHIAIRQQKGFIVHRRKRRK